MVIYADVLFFINFCADYICLYVAGRICRVPLKAYRLIIASLLGGAYSLPACKLEGAAAIAASAAFAFVMCAASYGFESAASLAKRTSVFFGVSLLFGGASYALFSISGQFTSYNGVLYADIGVFPLLLAISAAALFTVLFIRKNRNMLSEKTAEVTLDIDGSVFCFNALVDSGLLLCDPISADPVLLIKKQSFDKICGGSSPETLDGFRLIPSDRGLISAFRPSNISVKSGDKKRCAVQALVGIDTVDGTFGGMEILLPASII